MFLWKIYHKLSGSEEVHQLLCTDVALTNSLKNTEQAQTGENA